ncbi:MAG: ATPase, T2SS/T4P/T4SS family [Planctomycetota bacterium]
MTTATSPFDALVLAAHAAGASDLHLVPGERPRQRLASGLVPVGEVLDAAALEAMASDFFGEQRVARQAREGSVQRPFQLGEARGVATLASTRGQHSIAVRFQRGPAALSLEVVRAPDVVREWLGASHGLIVVAGPHGSGKTTTLYAMTEWLIEHRELHLCTVEDPLAYELRSKRALVQQREVGVDVPSAAAGIEAAMGQDLDALVVTALPDLEALGAALHAAATGHLVLLQVHASSAADALERMIEATPESMQAHVRRGLAETLIGVLWQRLVPKAAGGRVAAYEVLTPGEGLRAALLSGGRLDALPRAEGSRALRDDLDALERAGTISPEAAAEVRAGMRG